MTTRAGLPHRWDCDTADVRYGDDFDKQVYLRALQDTNEVEFSRGSS